MEPTLDRVHAIAAEASYRRIPVKRELYADVITPIEAMRALRAASEHCFLLESAEADERWGRYTFLGLQPTLELTCSGTQAQIRYDVESAQERSEQFEIAHPREAIRRILNDYKSPRLPEFPPFSGGLVGYFSFDYYAYNEPTLKQNDCEQSGPDVDLMLFNTIIAFDSYRQKIILITGVNTQNIDESYQHAQDELDRIEDVLLNGARKSFEPLQLHTDPTPHFSQKEFSTMVQRAKDHIYEGDIFQVVLSNPLFASASGSLFDAYRVLRCENPSPYMFYFTSDDIEIAGASPETLTRLEKDQLYTFPLAGTRPRGANPEEDARLEAELIHDEKELAEHNMLVDLGRNDLGRICTPGSVHVENYMDVLRFSRVMHIGSTVTGALASPYDAIDAVDSVLPAGTLSGAPKVRACEIIHELENTPRGIYGGALGYLDLAGNMDICIAIRLAYKKNDTVCVQSGAGIVADSDPASEFQECQNKAGAVIDALRKAQKGLR